MSLISLFNVDYTVISNVLASRLKLALSIIRLDQTSSVPGQSIFDSLHLLRNIYDYVQLKNIPCAFLSLDQEKSFDSVSHDFLFKVLESLGFGISFRRWVQLLCTNVYSSVLANGHTSEPFRET